MLKYCQILVNTVALAGSMVVLSGCGQKGPLYLPTEPAAAQRATLPETLTPNVLSSSPKASTAPTAATPAKPASAP
ncbi:LPS translocon maturation chaperone LptM [Variovorax sp. HJSM1_2]|uniref:LPS translocon maturation chaperone LptM n=1 Tax=Variovorax sp. HJSM1_2 TaxID=3366263 RepID=UPI003BCDB203